MRGSGQLCCPPFPAHGAGQYQLAVTAFAHSMKAKAVRSGSVLSNLLCCDRIEGKHRFAAPCRRRAILRSWWFCWAARRGNVVFNL
jgi:hypothetical protein